MHLAGFLHICRAQSGLVQGSNVRSAQSWSACKAHAAASCGHLQSAELGVCRAHNTCALSGLMQSWGALCGWERAPKTRTAARAGAAGCTAACLRSTAPPPDQLQVAGPCIRALPEPQTYGGTP